MENNKFTVIFVIFYTWLGTSNASVNLAFKKQARQSSILDGHGPDLVVDGILMNSQTGYCMHTLPGTQVWWQVDLGQISQIKTVGVLYGKNMASSLDNIRFYLSDDRNWWNGSLCYKNNPNVEKLPEEFRITCSVSGRFLTVYNDRNSTGKAYLDLCEVQVNGCPMGKHGHGDCLSDCQPPNCKTCDPESGVCISCDDGRFGLHCNQQCMIPNCKSCDRFNGTKCSVCKDGYAGNKCQECVAGRHGPGCKLECPRYCFNKQCGYTGLCSQGCVPGFKGPTCNECVEGRYGLYCNLFCQLPNCKACGRTTGACTKCKDNYTGPQCQSCIVGKYGPDCFQNCPSGCRDSCNRNTGNCNNGCKDGWGGLRCEECGTGRYGQFCSKECPKQCRGNLCERPTGICSQGCNTGWTGNLCHDCSDGYFGKQCNQRCFCKFGRCYKASGFCLSGGCASGFMGPSCNISCPSGTFGSGCKEKCHCRYQTCGQTGRCSQGCQAGYTGQSCNQECADFRYGFNCLKSCKCAEGPCNKGTGMCPLGGCEAGYHGKDCSTECIPGRYGRNCAEVCHCRSGYCSKITGLCYQQGCMAGYHGTACNQKCSDTYFGYSCSSRCFCKNGTCNHVNGLCSKGECKDGYIGSNCNIACSDGMFGPSCSMNCYCANGPCDKSTGTCPPGGCLRGWQGSTCNQRCNDGYFGPGCSKRCRCKSGPCESLSGKCIRGACQDGYTGPTCSNECPYGSYGENCTSSCVHCINEKCNHINGSCISGCKSGWRGNTCDIRSSAVQKSENKKDSMVPIFGGAIAGGLLVIVLIIVVVCMVRRRHKKSNNEGISRDNRSRNLSMENLTEERETSSSDEHVYTNAAMTMEAEKDGVQIHDSCEYYNVFGNDTEISVLGDLIKYKMEHDTFEEEYQKLPTGMVHPHNASLHPENKVKNRFISVYSYDHSRVILSKIHGQDNSDYINANYIDGVDVHRSYIAAQGPKKATVLDFWRMIWENDCNKIVMLTGLVENGKIKCEKYWPSDDNPLDTGKIHIELKDTKKYTFYTKRIFSVTVRETMETRSLTQYHFTTWPDHGTPDPLHLVDFHRAFIEEEQGQGPTVVHCSAGIGRTGTFIALDALYKYGIKTGKINIFEYVKTMRKDRMNMIQTLDQYVFLHDALLEAFNYKDTTIKKENFLQLLDEVKKEPKNQNRIRIEFQALESGRPSYPKSFYKSSHDADNCDKHRGNIYALDKFRSFLMSHDSSRNNYINAVSLASYKQGNAYIATHYPIESTVEDFWCLVYDHSHDVIIFDDKKEETSWLPNTDTELQSGVFKVRTKSEKQQGSHIVELEVSIHHKSKGTRHVKVLVVSLELDLASHRDHFLKLSELAELKHTSRPVIVVCPDGAIYCGIFCAVNSIIQRIQIDKEVDIFHTVKQLQVRRPEFITNFEQYELLYEIIKDHLNNEPIYMNTKQII